MELPIAVVDDLQPDRDRLSRDIRAFFDERQETAEISVYESAEAFLAQFRPGGARIAFLDIRMDDMNGIELAKCLRAKDTELLIIFLTSSPEYAFEAFPVHPFDYLMKPYELTRLHDVLNEALRVLSVPEPEIAIRVSRASYQVPLRKLCAVVSQGHALQVTTTDGQNLRSIMTYGELRSQLEDDPRFLECNRGVIVNMDEVLSLSGDTIDMKNGTSYPLRVRNRSEILNRFSQYMISRVKGV